MSSNSTLPLPPVFPPASVERTAVTQVMNSSNLYVFLMGAYVAIYMSTLYLYMTRKANQRKIVIIAISLLFLITVLQFAIETFTSVSNSPALQGSLDEAYMSLFSNSNPPWAELMLNITAFLQLRVADLLLIWRCYHIYGGSYRIIALPLFLVFAETGLSVASIIYLGVIHLEPSDLHQEIVINCILSALVYASCVASVTTSAAIAYRIYKSSRVSTKRSSRKKFMHIVEIIVQSALVYSIILPVGAISGSIPQTSTSSPSPTLLTFSVYCTMLMNISAAVIPTLMVALVCVVSSSSGDNVDRISKFPTMPSPQDASGLSPSEDPQIQRISLHRTDSQTSGSLAYIDSTR